MALPLILITSNPYPSYHYTSSDMSMKIVERAVHKQTYQHLVSNKLLSSHQSGFRPDRWTTTCLLDLSDFVLKDLDQGCLTGAVFLDLKKVFDMIDHSILKTKLAHVGITGHALKWFDNYLSGRTQSVCINAWNHF